MGTESPARVALRRSSVSPPTIADDRQEGAFRAAARGRTLVAVWRSEPTPARLARFYTQLNRLSQQHPEGVFVFNVIKPSTPMPGSEARAVLARQFGQMRGKVAGCAIVLEKEGVQGSMSRAVLSTLSTLTRHPFPMKVFSRRVEGAIWLATLGAENTGAQLPETAAALETQLERFPSGAGGRPGAE